MKVCGRCKAFVQPSWERCKICGADASGAAPHEPAPLRTTPTGAGDRGRSSGSRAGLALVGVVVVGLVALGGWYVLDQDSQDEDAVAAAGAPTTTAPPSSGDPKVDAFAALAVTALASEGITVDRACAQSVAARPEHASVVGEAMDSAFSDEHGDPAVDALVEDLSLTIIIDCVGVATLMTQVMTDEYGLSPASAACVGDAFAADPAMAEAFRSLADVEPGPDLVAAMVNCLTPAELEAVAAAEAAP